MRTASLPRFDNCAFDPAMRGIGGNYRDMAAAGISRDQGEIGTFHVGRMTTCAARVADPRWVYSDQKMRIVLRTLFPKLDTDPRQRERAGQWNLVTYLFYRLHWPDTQVAAEVGLSRANVKQILYRLRSRADQILADSITEIPDHSQPAMDEIAA